MSTRSVPRIGGKRPPRLYIQEWMDKRGMTQTDVGNRLEVNSTGTISKKLKSPQKMSAEWLAAFAWALDLEGPQDLYRHPDAPTRDELLKGVGEPNRAIILKMIDAAKSA